MRNGRTRETRGARDGSRNENGGQKKYVYRAYVAPGGGVAPGAVGYKKLGIRLTSWIAVFWLVDRMERLRR